MAYDEKMKIRRRIIKGCVVNIFGSSILCILFVFFGDEEMRKNLDTVISLVMAINLFCTTLIAAYMGMVHHGDLKGGDNAGSS